MAPQQQVPRRHLAHPPSQTRAAGGVRGGPSGPLPPPAAGHGHGSGESRRCPTTSQTHLENRERGGAEPRSSRPHSALSHHIGPTVSTEEAEDLPTRTQPSSAPRTACRAHREHRDRARPGPTAVTGELRAREAGHSSAPGGSRGGGRVSAPLSWWPDLRSQHLHLEVLSQMERPASPARRRQPGGWLGPGQSPHLQPRRGMCYAPWAV